MFHTPSNRALKLSSLKQELLMNLTPMIKGEMRISKVLGVIAHYAWNRDTAKMCHANWDQQSTNRIHCFHFSFRNIFFFFARWCVNNANIITEYFPFKVGNYQNDLPTTGIPTALCIIAWGGKIPAWPKLWVNTNWTFKKSWSRGCAFVQKRSHFY